MLTFYIKPDIIYNPNDEETAILQAAVGRWYFRSPGGDPFEIFANGGGRDYIRLGRTTTKVNTSAPNVSKGTAVRIPGHISASNHRFSLD